MDVTMKPVESSNVRSYGYDEKSSTLVILYKSGEANVRWDYDKVPPEIVAEMDQIVAAGDSIGKYISRRIKGYFDGRKVSE